MPKDEQGNKWSCVACIRGHRTAKCNHLDDRWLVKVKKPGRPQTKCPTPQNCNCPTEMVKMEKVGTEADGTIIVRPVESMLDLPPRGQAADENYPPAPPSTHVPYFTANAMQDLYSALGMGPTTRYLPLPVHAPGPYPPMEEPRFPNLPGHDLYPSHSQEMSLPYGSPAQVPQLREQHISRSNGTEVTQGRDLHASPHAAPTGLPNWMHPNPFSYQSLSPTQAAGHHDLHDCTYIGHDERPEGGGGTSNDQPDFSFLNEHDGDYVDGGIDFEMLT